jgi:tetratricopeptide (TPR) repeat protein
MSNRRHIDENSKSLLGIFERTGCLSEEALLNYVKDKLSATDKKRAEMHLLDCRLCTDALEGMALLSPAEFSKHTTMLRQRVSINSGAGAAGRVVRFRPWRLAAAATVIGSLATLGWLTTRYLNDRSEQIAKTAFEENYTSYTPPATSHDTILLAAPEAAEGYELSGDGPATDASGESPVLSSRYVDDLVDVTGEERDEESPRPEAFDATANATTIRMDTAYSSPTSTGGTNTYSWTQGQELKEVETVSASKGRSAKEDRSQQERVKNTDVTKPAAATSEEYIAAADPEVKQRLLDDGVNYYQAKQNDQAIGNFNQVLAVEPSNETALFYSAVAYIEQGQPALALVNLDRLLQNKNSAYFDSAQWYRAMALLNDGQRKSAKKQLNDIIGTGSSYEGQAREALNDL